MHIPSQLNITKLYAKLYKRGRPCGATPLFYHEALPPFDHPDMEEYGDDKESAKR